jgi:hypothetical protein
MSGCHARVALAAPGRPRAEPVTQSATGEQATTSEPRHGTRELGRTVGGGREHNRTRRGGATGPCAMDAPSGRAELRRSADQAMAGPRGARGPRRTPEPRAGGPHWAPRAMRWRYDRARGARGVVPRARAARLAPRRARRAASRARLRATGAMAVGRSRHDGPCLGPSRAARTTPGKRDRRGGRRGGSPRGRRRRGRTTLRRLRAMWRRERRTERGERNVRRGDRGDE